MNNNWQKYYCYILSNKNRTVLYVGNTDNLERRINQHKNGTGALFIKKYNVYDLIYIEEFNDRSQVKSRELQLENWHKEWKWNIIKRNNPNLETLRIN